MSSKKQSKNANRKHHGKAPHGYGGIRPAKGLGQNFLIDEGVIEEIAEGSGAAEDALVIEIGPGAGALTIPLAERSGYLAAIEIDENLIEPLRVKTFGMDNVEIIHADILAVNLDELIESRLSEYGLKNVRVVGNLPYYITTPIIMKLLETAHGIDSITVMMQKEVGDRIAAEPGTRAAGAITYPVYYHASVRKIADVPRECFYPAPKVDSVVLRLDIREKPAAETKNTDLMFKCVKAGFSQRRKTLLNSLSAMEGMDKETINSALERAGIDQSRRAETLTLTEFAKIADILQEA
ncbi:MAG: 16S rRNA (adenine(1518)-N(6)/adenine(1519)-N(6))-dimethyltransferase RsmA [Mogibacterium sp.]|nr:16S rRNA (adenine(1518)-N(6)/adenine(1519)-N(6))-dimethyltransferase RsmA [Mogibacterium sp.]